MSRRPKRARFAAVAGTFLIALLAAAATPTHATTSRRTTKVLPNPELTPGALNRHVRQATIGRTICVRGWTATVRPPVSYTNRLKLRQMLEYGESGSPSAYEEDHLVPLELGGAPRNPANLWPEPRRESNVSDPLETVLKRKVCAGAITLARARAEIRAFKFAHG